jgi:hypothetical protein
MQITRMQSIARLGGMSKVELDWVVRFEVHGRCWEIQVCANGKWEVAANETVAATTLLEHWRTLYLVDIPKAVHGISTKP